MEAAIADGLVQPATDAFRPEVGRVGTGAGGHPDDRVAADEHRRRLVGVGLGILG